MMNPNGKKRSCDLSEQDGHGSSYPISYHHHHHLHQRNDEHPISRTELIEEAETPTCGHPRHWRGVGWTGPRGSRDQTTKCPTTSCTLRWSGFQHRIERFNPVSVLTVVADDPQRNQKSAASAAAKSTLYRVKESPKAYLPLKSIAGYLWYILDNCVVWSPSHPSNLQC